MGTGVFTCADAALTSLSPARLGALAKETEGATRSELERAAEGRDALQARYLVGRALSLGLAAASVTVWLLARPWAPPLRLAVAVGCALVLLTLTVVSATLGRAYADSVVPAALRLLRPLELLLAPLAGLTRLPVRILRRRAPRHHERRLAETEVELMVDAGERSGLLVGDGAEIIRNVIEFRDLTAGQVMVSRTKMVAFRVDTPIEEVLATITETGHSRYPVYRDDIDGVYGLLYAKDLFVALRRASRRPPPDPHDQGRGDDEEPTSWGETRLQDVVRTPVKYVPESQPLHAVLREMRQERQHLAVVVDEFGGVGGIVTLEDVLEEIVGDILDESDVEEAPIVELGDGRLLADAGVCVGDLATYLGQDLDPRLNYETLGAMLVDRLGQVPSVGTTIRAYGMRFIIRESDEKHIERVEVVGRNLHAPADEAEPTSGAHPLLEPTTTEPRSLSQSS